MRRTVILALVMMLGALAPAQAHAQAPNASASASANANADADADADANANANADAPVRAETARVASDPRELAHTLAEALDAVRWREWGFALAVEFGGSFLGPLIDGSGRSITVDYGLRGGYHFGDWAVVGFIEHAMWKAPELGSRARQHVINVGVGVARYHRSGLLRTMLLAGPSILLRSNDLDSRGQTGIFVDIRPLGFSWRFGDRGALVADLFHMSLVAPVLTGVPLADIQFRSSLGIEAIF